MAIYPKAKVKLLPESATQPLITPTQVIAHTAVDGKNTTSLYDWFDKPSNLESHFYVAADGTVEQYIDTGVRADANNKANGRAVSIETHDGWASTGKKGSVTTPWTPAQVASLTHLIGWICDTHRIPRAVAPGWDRPGIGWHNLYPQWSPGATGCPGPTRTAQLRDQIIPALSRPNIPQVEKPAESEEDDVAQAILWSSKGEAWHVVGNTRVYLSHPDQVALLKFLGVKEAFNADALLATAAVLPRNEAQH